MAMKAPMLLLSYSAFFWAGTASAQQASDVSGTVSIDGIVTPLCQLGPPSRTSVDLGVLIATSGQRAGRMAAFGPQQINLPGSFCNFAGSAVSISAKAMLSDADGDVPAGFARAVNFTSTVSNWASENAVVTTSASAAGDTSDADGSGGIMPEPHVADLPLVLSNFTAPGDNLLIAGSYSGTVTITLGPAETAN